MQTLDQQIAAKAHTAITSMGEITSETCGHIKKTASRLRTAGLGVTLAFCLKGDDKSKKDLEPVANAIAACVVGLPGVTGVSNAVTLRDKYINSDMREVRLLTTYVSQALEWLGRWADSYKKRTD